MPSAYSRVTITSTTRRVDLALPRAVPVTDLLPQLLALCAPEVARTDPVGWRLIRFDGEQLPGHDSLESAGVRDGEVIALHDEHVDLRPAVVEDVRDWVEDTMSARDQRWRPVTTVRFAALAAGCLLALAVALPEARTRGSLLTLVTAAALAVLLGAAAWWWARRDLPGPTHLYTGLTHLYTAVACLWAGVAAWLAARWLGWPVLAAGAAGLGGAWLTAVAVRLTTPLVVWLTAATSVLAPAGVAVAVTAAAGGDPWQAVRVVAVLAVLAVGALPRLSLTLGGLAAADYRVRTAGELTVAELTHRMHLSDGLLLGGLVGLALLGGAASAALGLAGEPADLALGVAVAVALLLRSRIFSQVPHVLPTRVAALAAAAAQVVWAARDLPGVRAWTVVALTGATAGVVALSTVRLSDIARARVKRILDWCEVVAVIAMIGVLAWRLGVFAPLMSADADAMAEVLP